MPLSLHLSPSPPAPRSSPSPPAAAKHRRMEIYESAKSCFSQKSVYARGRSRESFAVRCSLDTVDVTVGEVTEVSKDSFWPIVKAAGNRTVVLDMYTQWCGPCKVIAPKFKELSKKYEDVVFLKLDCNNDNRPLVKELGLKVVPTFKILKDGGIVKEVTGAKLDDIVAAIDSLRSN